MNSSNSLGILSILPNPHLHSTPPLRRTLSADMSSSSWLKNNHINPDFDSFSSILSDPPKPPVVPYVHPLLKKSTNFLNQNSLLICTETLGSDSGSDGFSSESKHFAGDLLKTECSETETYRRKQIKFPRNKTPPRSFPPPIPSLNSPDGGSICVQSRRESGRLILDAVSVPSRKNFRAERRDGRLILSYETTTTATTTPANSKVQDVELDLVTAPRLSSSVLNFHRLAMMMKKPNGMINRNPAWRKDKESPLSQSLPPRPPSTVTAAAAPSLNVFEYYWRSKPAGISQQHNQPMKNVTGKVIYSNNEMANDKQQILVLRGNRGDYLVPLSNGCKVPRRSLLLREPCCIATT